MGRLEERLARKHHDELVAYATRLRATLRETAVIEHFEEPAAPHSRSTLHCTICNGVIAADRHTGHKPWCLCADDLQNERETLPQRRTGAAVDFTYGAINATFTAAFSLYADGRCAEIFLSCDRSQGDLEANVRDAGILVSFALQHGASLETLIAGVTHEEDGSCSSIVGLALNLVRAEIARIHGRDPDPSSPGASAAVASAVSNPADDVPAPPGMTSPIGPGGGAPARAVPTSDIAELEPADPKEACNDGDPIRIAHTLWPLCQACGCRHDPLAFCVDAEQARARNAEDTRVRVR